MSNLWRHSFAQRTQGMSSSAIRELLKLTEQPDMISFSGGLPAPEVFPVQEFAAATERVLRDMGPQALQYGPTEGYRPLREMIVRDTRRQGLNIGLDNVLITTGSQQALDLIGKILINPGDRIVVEAPTYVGALQAWNVYGADYVQVPADDDGMQTDRLEAVLRTRPKLVYCLPNFQNPSGVTLSLARRQRLVELAREYGVVIVEDDPYGALRFEGEDLPGLIGLDSQLETGGGAYQGHVIALRTFSKTLAPGIRIAWVVAPAEVIRLMVQAKQGSDLHSSSLNQMVAYEVARDGFLERHVPVIRQVYRERRDLMIQAMTEFFPPGVHWTYPQGGLFLWVTLPQGVDGGEVLRQAIEEKVAFVPGASFFPCGGGENTFRLNFSNASPEKIREGIARLGRVLHTMTPVYKQTP